MRVEKLYRYPVKGLSAEALEETELATGECIPHDRRFALVQGDAPFDVTAPRFLPKQNFACLMANARLALVKAAFDPHDHCLSLRVPGQPVFFADTQTAEGRASITAALTAFLGDEARGTPYFTEAPGHAFTDQKRKGISLINLASLEALQKATGLRLDPLRFRANVYFTGLPAWAEFDWLGQEIMLGGARLSVFKRTVRCPATQVNPSTGERDADVPRLLREHFGHADLGVHAAVTESGKVALGDALEALMPA
ncbi:MOSC domain-containing protein [Teichococcus oryzae]|uniref:MOSC domain-containing protein n=1 Tax=Teichococcus oryzae TaxID=1608942 RepID=A0A5B2TAB1_9PROT|nr:MOSC N-terminal beta barrel domain-containing protein [Pseudoroseomonas oryzae]KAA2211506.1 MOSC domain-containing protein [Pseudoroseomonas oryzae]